MAPFSKSPSAKPIATGWSEPVPGRELQPLKSSSPEALAQAVDSLDDQPLGYRINIFLARLCFRGIYFPMMGRLAWLKVVAQNRRTIFKLVKEAFFGGRTRPRSLEVEDSYEDGAAPDVSGEVSA